jgi:TolA-binding protein
VLGVIVLTDNRQRPPSQKHPSPPLRFSAFTPTHHLESSCEPNKSDYDEEVMRLSERVSALEQRIFELSHLEAADHASRPPSHKKKQRRKFKDLVRDQQVPQRPLSAPSATRPTARRLPSSTTSNSNTPGTTKIIPNRTDFYCLSPIIIVHCLKSCPHESPFPFPSLLFLPSPYNLI